jgi:hypothetical protein
MTSFEAAESICGSTNVFLSHIGAYVSVVVGIIAVVAGRAAMSAIPDVVAVDATIVEGGEDRFEQRTFDGLISTKETRTTTSGHGKNRRTVQRVVDVIRFPDGQTIECSAGLHTPDESTSFPVHKESGEVRCRTRVWNECASNAQIKGKEKTYGVSLPHDDVCSTLTGTVRPLYHDPKTDTVSASSLSVLGEYVAQAVILFGMDRLLLSYLRLRGLSRSDPNNPDEYWVASYKLPEEIANAAPKYAIHWTRAFRADKAEECLKMLPGGLGDQAAGAASLFKLVDDYRATVALENEIAKLTGGGHSSLTGLLLRRALYTLLAAVVTNMVVGAALRRGAGPESRATTAPMEMQIGRTVVSAFAGLIAARYVALVHLAYVRRSFKAVADLSEAAEAEFPDFDLVRIAI